MMSLVVLDQVLRACATEFGDDTYEDLKNCILHDAKLPLSLKKKVQKFRTKRAAKALAAQLREF